MIFVYLEHSTLKLLKINKLDPSYFLEMLNIDKEFEYMVSMIQKFSFSLFELNHNFVLTIFNITFNIITWLTEKFEKLELFVVPYLKLLLDFIYYLPELYVWTIDRVLNAKPSIESAIVYLKANVWNKSETSIQICIVALTFMLTLILFIIFYYKWKVNLLELRNEELENNPTLNMCCICKHKNSNVILLPCAHLCICLKCFYTMKKNSHGALADNCPMCRAPIEREIRIYS